MDCVERIKKLCAEKGIAIARLEKDCGFANGYISGLRRGTMPADRLQKVADYLGVSPSYLLTGEEHTGYYVSVGTMEVAQDLLSNRDLKLLFDEIKNATPEQLQLLRAMARSWK